jgi:uncharacterized protein (TIGR03067 family)
MVVQPASKPSLTLHLDHPGLRVVTVGEDGTNYECKKDAFLATVGELPPGRYHTRVYRPDNPEVLVAQKTFELIVPGHAFEFRVDSNWTQLFNGQDLTGWKVFPEDRKSWKVVDGVLTGKGAPSHLFSERGDYASFHLRMEMRVNKSGACGHWSRVPFGDPRILHYPYGDGSLYTTPVAALYSKDGVTRDPGQPRNRPSSLMVSGVGWGSDGPKNVLKIPENEWFISEVILDGNTLMIKSPRLSQSNPYFRGSATEGHLALQLFDSESVVEYRNIEIKEIKGSTRDEDRLQGSWHAVGGEFAGLKLSDDELKLAKLAFTGEQMRGTFPPKGLAGEGSFKLNPMASPKQITVKATGSSNSTLEGIYRFEGERLVLCMGGGADQRPTEFSSKGARSYGVLVLERDTVSPVADEKRLQGNWKIVGHEEGGVPLSARLIPSPEVMSIAIAGDRASLKSSVPLKVGGDVSPKVTWEGVFHVDPKASPKRINVFIPGDNKNSMIGIYRFDGDRLVLCFISNPIKLEYPTEFATQKGDGLVMMTLEKFESKSVTPFELTPPKVLPHMVGTWSFEMERQSTADGKERGKSMGLVVVEPVAGGEHFAIRTQSSDGGPSGLSIITLDKQSSRFKSRFFDPSGYVSDTASGDFDAKAKVLLMTNTTKDNLVLTRRQTFINADTIEMKVTTHDKAGKVVFEGKGMMRRLPKGRAIDEAAVEAQLVPKEMAQLERFVGTWDLEFRSRIRPDNRWQAELTIRKVLGGRFIETREVVPLTGEQHIMLATYDAEKKVYYHWYWSSVQPQAEGPSTWDEGTKSLKWEGKVGDESAMTRSSSVVWKFTTGDKIELRVAIKDKDGAVIDELEGTHTRRAKSK